MYLVKTVRESLSTSLNGLILAELKLIWAKGMVGACPVFEKKEDALVFTGGREDLIVECEDKNETV